MRLSDAPRFLLFADSVWKPAAVGHWRFRIESIMGQRKFEADGDEAVANRDRLDLLAVVRGLESLNQPTHVTLVTGSRYVGRGLRFGLKAWRENDWSWESYGLRTEVRDADLWRRVDGALRFHRVDCRVWSWESRPSDAHQIRTSSEPGRPRASWWRRLLGASPPSNSLDARSADLAAIPS